MLVPTTQPVEEETIVIFQGQIIRLAKGDELNINIDTPNGPKKSKPFYLEEYQLIDEDTLPIHPDAYIEAPCCPGGTTDCACNGRSSLVCPAVDCPGIDQGDVEKLFERLEEQL